MKSIKFSKLISITATTSAIITEAIRTTTALFINSGQVGQLTLLTSSSYEAFIFCTRFIYLFLKTMEARVERLELPTPGFGDQCSTN